MHLPPDEPELTFLCRNMRGSKAGQEIRTKHKKPNTDQCEQRRETARRAELHFALAGRQQTTFPAPLVVVLLVKQCIGY